MSLIVRKVNADACPLWWAAGFAREDFDHSLLCGGDGVCGCKKIDIPQAVTDTPPVVVW